MSAALSDLRTRTNIVTDGWGLLLAGLFLTVLVGSVALAQSFASAGVEPAMSGSSSSQQAAAGAGWAIAEVVVAVIGIVVFLLWKRLPAWGKEIVKKGVVIVGSMMIGASLPVSGYGAGAFWAIAGGLVGYYALVRITDEFDVFWHLNNLHCVFIAILLGGTAGAVLPFKFLLVGIILLTVYDHVFANQNDWMFTLGEGMMRAKLPVLFLAIPRLRLSWDDLCADIGGKEDVFDDEIESMVERGDGFGIGMADLMLPAALAASLTVSSGGVSMPVVGMVGGLILAAFRLRYLMVNADEAGAGMPSITAGTVGGYLVMALPWVVLG